jgi:hypothetical protein
MPIDKMIPRFLVSDEDERLLKEGAMTDALNVTISEDGDGSEGVLKNVKGTTAITGATLGIGDDEVKVIGQVSDSQLGCIYFFVATDEADVHTHDAIYRVNTNTNATQLVFKNTWLNFNENGFVKADVLNGAFQQDGIIQTILYFTDNKNAPRKINVDRAIAGDYSSLSSGKLDYALNSIKAAPTKPPTFYFSTDTSIDANNFRLSTFQFAYQYVYTDGEESAISSYSSLCFPDSSSIIGIDNSSVGSVSTSNYYEDNVCNIKLNWSSISESPKNIPDVKKVRLLARKSNTGAFRVIDEFDPNANLNRYIYGNSVSVYDKDTAIYRFFNEGAYAATDVNTVNKLYDNVPLKTEGQAITGNRLMYSNYSEGFANGDSNGDPVDATLTVSYSAARGGGENGSSATGISEDNSNTNGDIAIDFSTLFTTSNVPAGSTTTVKFETNPSGFFGDAPDGAVVLDAVDSLGGTFQVKFGEGPSGSGAASDRIPIYQVSDGWNFELTLTNASDMTHSEFATFFANNVTGYNFSKTYDVLHSAMQGVVVDGSNTSLFGTGDIIGLDNGNYSVTTAWTYTPADINVSSAVVTLKPRIYFASISGWEGGTVGVNTYAITTQSFLGGGLQGTMFYDIPSANLSGKVFSSTANHSLSTFKAGSTHEIGVVYYDKYNRSGNVNKIGSVYVLPFGDSGRSGDNGPASISVAFNSQPPTWADRYQFVYPGMGSFDSVVSYTVGGAYYNVNDDQDRRVYVSLNTLDDFSEEKSALLNYSFTEGDKLRVINYDSASGAYATNPLNVTYPRANDGSVIEFDVVGVEIIDSEKLHTGSNHQAGQEDPHHGTFLVLESPAIHANLQVDSNSDGTVDTGLKYVGFDWYSISNSTYPDSGNTAATNANYWGQRCLVEILTPSKIDKEVYYEIGESYPIGPPRDQNQGSNNHGPLRVLNYGDVHYRPTSCKTPFRDPNHQSQANEWNEEHPEDWRYETIYTESQSVSDFFSSSDWNKGRAHIVFENAAEVRRLNGITYSEAYAEDVANLSLSSFNPSLANFDSLDGRYGAINYIGNYNDDLVALQENKFCLIPVNKNILEYASGSADVTVSTNVLNQRRYSAGDYGCSNHPEAVLIQDNSVFFVDESRQAVCALTGGQLVPISDKSMSSFFENFFTNSHTKYVSGYDPRDNTYYLTGLGGTAETVGYDAARGVWQSRYSFAPDIYSNQNNMLFSAKYTSGDNLFWKHDSTTYNSFYGTGYPSEVQMVSKLSPSRVKVFNALSYEGDSALWDVSTNDIETDLGQITGGITEWRKNEGSYYAPMPRNKNAGSTGSNKSTIYLGNLTSVTGSTYSSDLRLNRLPIPTGVTVVVRDLDVPSTYLSVQVSSVSNNQITFSSAVPAAKCQLEITESIANAVNDPMRGHWMKIKMQNSDTTKHELYCINTHITDSKSHHPLGG